MGSLSLRKKLWLPLVVGWFALLILTVVDAVQMRQMQLNARRLDLAHVIDMSVSIVRDYARLAEAGRMNVDEAKSQASARVGAQRYGSDGYVTIVDTRSVVVNNPLSPKLNGKDMSLFKDAKGKLLYQAIAAAGANPAGGDYLEYWWPKPGAKEASEKMSYVGRFAPWQWDFVAGAYMDDIQKEFYWSLGKPGAALVLIGVAMSLLCSALSRSITRSIGGEPAEAARVASAIAAGDLSVTVEIDGEDHASLLYALKTMRDQLVETVRGIQAAAAAITGASGEIAAGNQDLSSRTEQQAASLQQTAASMDGLTATVNHNTDNARQAATLAADASTTAARGGAEVGEAVATMRSISDSSRRVGEITAVIDGIAFQTNILALNAAVEAARAGDQGRGFAVVAGEVRTLAQRSAAAAKEIKTLIERSSAEVESGAAQVERAGTTMEQVVAAVARVTRIVDEIAAASAEQSTGIGEINRAVREMDEVTQRNAALVEEAAAAAQSLVDQAERLRGSASTFRLAGSSSASPAASRLGPGLPAFA